MTDFSKILEKAKELEKKMKEISGTKRLMSSGG